MSEVKWIKLATNMFDNRKIKQISFLPEGDAIIVIWVNLLCLAGTINDCGMVYFAKDLPYTEQMLAQQFNRPINIIHLAIKTFEKFNMIEVVDDFLKVSNWEEYQNIEALDKIREQNRVRALRYRYKQKLLSSPKATSDMRNVTHNATITQSNATDIDIDKELDLDLDKDLEEEKNKEKDKRINICAAALTQKSKSFVKPTLEELKTYSTEKQYTDFDAERFYDFYESKGWFVGKNKMKDWKAAARNWQRNNKPMGKKKAIDTVNELMEKYRKEEEDEQRGNP